MDKNDGTVKQFVPSEISETIQVKYVSAWTKMWDANKVTHYYQSIFIFY